MQYGLAVSLTRFTRRSSPSGSETITAGSSRGLPFRSSSRTSATGPGKPWQTCAATRTAPLRWRFGVRQLNLPVGHLADSRPAHCGRQIWATGVKIARRHPADPRRPRCGDYTIGTVANITGVIRPILGRLHYGSAVCRLAYVISLVVRPVSGWLHCGSLACVTFANHLSGHPAVPRSAPLRLRRRDHGVTLAAVIGRSWIVSIAASDAVCGMIRPPASSGRCSVGSIAA